MFLKESFCGLRFFRIVKPVYILGSAWSIANYTPYSTCFCFSSFVLLAYHYYCCQVLEKN